MEANKEYYAFISYRREDEKWAKWLAHKLETYLLPTTLNGKELPKNMRPIFRDVDELSAGNLPEQIYHALSISKNLIVICSPRSAHSEWVNKEIQDFITIKGGKADNIYPFIIEGTPFAKESLNECFPNALRMLPNNEERLGGNINEQGGREAAVVKIISGMLGVTFDSLWQKHEREQKKKRAWIIAAAITAFLCISCIAFWMYYQNQQTQKANWKMMENRARFVAEKGEQLIKDGDSYLARLLALEILPTDLNNPDKPYTLEAEGLLRNALMHNNAILKLRHAILDTLYNETGLDYTGLDRLLVPAKSASFSPDGKKIVSTSWDNSIRLWNADTGEEIGEPLTGHTADVNDASFSPDGKRIVSVSKDSTIRIWDTETGKQIGEPITGHTSNVNYASFSPDGKRIVSVSEDSTIRIWNAKTRKQIGEPITVHTNNVISASFSPDGKRIVSISQDNGTIRIWDAETGKEIGEPLNEILCYVNSASLSPDGKIIASGLSNEIGIWDVETRKLIGIQPTGHTDWIYSTSFSPDGKKIVSTSWDKTIRIWNAETRKQIGEPLTGHTSHVCSASFSPDGKRIVSASMDGTIRIWDLEKSNIINKEFNISESNSESDLFNIDIEKTYDVLSISPDGKKIVSASLLGSTIRIWDVETREVIRAIHTDYKLLSASFSPNGKEIALVSMNDSITIWDVETGKQIGEPITGHTKYIHSASFSPDGKKIVSASADSTIRIWDTETGEQIEGPLSGHTDDVYSASFSPDGKKIVSASFDKTIRIWDAETGIQIGEPLTGHTDDILSASFSPDGKKIVSVSYDKTIRIWDVETGKQLGAQLIGKSEDIKYVSFSPDGKEIISAFEDGTIRFWDITPLQELIDSTRERFKDRKLTTEEKRRFYLE